MKISYLTLALGWSAALLGSGSAQTLIDTSAAIGVNNTLQSISGPGTNIVPQVQERLNGIMEGQQAAQAGVLAPAAVSATGTPAVQPEYLPLTGEQRTALQGAYTALEQGGAGAARSAFEALISQNYRHPEAHFGLALALLAQGQTEAARFELGQLVQLAPNRFEGPYNLGVLAVQAADYTAARGYFEQAAQLAKTTGNEDVQLYVLDALASEQARAQDWAGLRATLGEMVTLAPGDAELQLRLAQAQALLGEGVAALPGAYQALGSAQTQVSAALLLADIYLAQGLPERGLGEVDRVLATTTDPASRAPLLLRRAALLGVVGQLDEAVTAAAQGVRLNNKDAGAWALLGNLRSRAGQTQQALQAYREAALLEPRSAAYRTELATLRLRLNRYAEARRDAELALNLEPDAVSRARAELVLGLLDYRSDRYASAANLLRASASSLPTAETWLWLGLSEYQLGNYTAAAEALGQSVSLDPAPLARLNLGSALLASGRAAEAEVILQALVTETPGNAQAWYVLGLAQREQGRAADARRTLGTAAELGSAAARGALE
ncbi:tetratricopeptide repeat protein [Deinococcus radiophilus]|nr:tetratricopeptide repeat protein [Deinococcus radiophilus]UFA51335.1 tetratricopeptide repeat protein [Deinococcus radiophilus]